MNKKGQVGFFGALLAFFLFILFWAAGFSKVISDVGQNCIDDYSLSGLLAWICGNLNFILFIFIILALIWFSYMGSGG